MLRRTILAASRDRRVKALVAGSALSRGVVARFVAGTSPADAVRVARRLDDAGLAVSLDRLGEDVHDAAQVAATVRGYRDLLDALADEGLTDGGRCEVSLKLSALGSAFDLPMAVDAARTVCAAANGAGTKVTVDMEDSPTTDATLDAVRALREDFPATGAVLQAYLRRTEADCRDLAHPGSRVRLCKGAYDEPESVAFRSAREVRSSYVRCLALLFAGGAYPMVATHDPQLLDVAQALAAARAGAGWEVQMLHGVRPNEQRRLVKEGTAVRVYVPYGDQWYEYLMRRLAEKPANLALFARALVDRS